MFTHQQRLGFIKEAVAFATDAEFDPRQMSRVTQKLRELVEAKTNHEATVTWNIGNRKESKLPAHLRMELPK